LRCPPTSGVDAGVRTDVGVADRSLAGTPIERHHTMAFVCSATWIAKPGRESIVHEALRNLSPASRTEEGNIYYQAYQDPETPGTFRIFEVYVDEAAFKAHAEYDHFVEFALGTAIPELETRQRDFYETLDF
jgi:quinol monooxygenase YgiN